MLLQIPKEMVQGGVSRTVQRMLTFISCDFPHRQERAAVPTLKTGLPAHLQAHQVPCCFGHVYLLCPSWGLLPSVAHVAHS